MANEKRLIDANALELHFLSTKLIEVFPDWKVLTLGQNNAVVRLAKKWREIVLSAKTVDRGVTVQEWIPSSEPPKKPGEYIVAQKHWCDGHLESKIGKWNGVDWFVYGRESLLVAYWMPMPEPPAEGNDG